MMDDIDEMIVASGGELPTVDDAQDLAAMDMPDLYDAISISDETFEELYERALEVEQLIGDGETIADGPWRVESDDRANWALRQLHRLDHRTANLKTYMKRERERYATFEAVQQAKLDHSRTFFEGQLERYMESLRRTDDKLITYPLPEGTLKVRDARVTTEVADEEALADWVQENIADPEPLLDATIKVKKAEVKKRWDGKVDKAPGEYPAVVPETQEVVPGVKFVRPEPKFSIDLAPAPDPEAPNGA